jgi:hypothetical protein
VKQQIVGKLNELASTLETLKVRVREAMAGEMAKAVGEAVREVLIVVLCEKFAETTRSYPPSRNARWRGEHEDDEWEDDYHHSGWKEVANTAVPQVSTAAALAVGVHVGRWLFRRQGSMPLSLGLGALTTLLGLSGGIATRSLLSVFTAGVDLMTADTELAR